MDGRQALDDLINELEDGQFGTKMRGYDPAEVDALLDRSARALADLRTSARRADERATLAERQLEEELEAARAARATAEAGIATSEAEAARIMADARAQVAELKAATEDEVRAAIESGRVQMEAEVSEAEGRRDRVLEEVDVTADHVAAHRARLLRAIADLQDLVEGIDERPTGVVAAPAAPAGPAPVASVAPEDAPLPPLPSRASQVPSTGADLPEPRWSEQARQDSDVVTPIRPVDQRLPGGPQSEVVGDDAGLDAFFADDGS
tara:strand:- start:82 stop:876 length:795 start_codon:yes stop_codon:yes gene_type:complete